MTGMPPEGTSWSGRRRHYAFAQHWTERGVDASRGHFAGALCSTEANPVVIYDQVARDVLELAGYKPVIVRQLPLCKKCERKAQLQ